MNEQDLRDAFRSTIALSQPPPPMSAPAAAGAGRRRLRRRNLLVGLGGAVTTIAIVAGLLLSPGTRNAAPPVTDRGPSTGASGSPEAQRIVRDAARTLRASADPAPRPEQFIYRKTVASFGNPPTVREIWLSVDGTADGLIKETAQNPTDPQRGPHIIPEAMVPGCRNGKVGIELVNNRPTQYVPCTPTPNYRTDVPTDGKGMLAYLDARMDRNNPGEPGRVLDPLRELFGSWHVPPSATAAVFEAAVQIPRLYVRAGIVDGTGRAAVAIGVYSTENFRNELLFDSVTYRYIGERAVETVAVNGVHTDSVKVYATVLVVTFVDRVGQRP